MHYRRFGRTELAMPVFSCGGMRYQYKWQDVSPEEIPEDNQANLEACIRRALELGINHIETARGYGSSEMQLGRILPILPRERMIVQTKVGPSPTGEQFRETFEKSYGYLKLDYLDLLSFHGINNDETLDWTLEHCLPVARQLQREGRIRHIGFSTHAPCRVILRAIDTGEFDYVNLHWYFVNDLNWPAVEAARTHDMGVFIISPTDKGGKLYDPPAKLVELCQPLSPIAFNDLYCLARPEVHTLSVGAARPSDFDEHVGALTDYDRIAEVVPPVVARLKAEMERTLGADWLRDWWRGLPEYQEVPGEVHILEILRLWNYASALDMEAWARDRYNLFGNGGHWFPGQNAEKADAATLAPALANSPFRERIPDVLRAAHTLLSGESRQRLSEG